MKSIEFPKSEIWRRYMWLQQLSIPKCSYKWLNSNLRILKNFKNINIRIFLRTEVRRLQLILCKKFIDEENESSPVLKWYVLKYSGKTGKRCGKARKGENLLPLLKNRSRYSHSKGSDRYFYTWITYTSNEMNTKIELIVSYMICYYQS